MKLEHLKKIKGLVKDELMKKTNVVGISIGKKIVGGKETDELCIVVMVSKKMPLAKLKKKDIIPDIIQNVRTDVVETGVIKALKKRTDKWRPSPNGVSIGHKNITAGTQGGLVEYNGKLIICSNNHVLANSNDAQIGDAILQPGPTDGGVINDKIAELTKFIPLNFSTTSPTCPFAQGTGSILNWLAIMTQSKHRVSVYKETNGVNLVDAAIAKPTSSDIVEKRILGIGVPVGTKEGKLDMKVLKSGRTTGLTDDKITQIDASVKVQYGGGRSVVFEDQLVAGPMSKGGDSGSFVLDNDKYVVGLLFAGSDASTIFNRIQNVEELLGIKIYKEA